MIQLRQIRHALVLARLGNFGRAAVSLGLTQPSLTRSIAGLEKSLGVKLFDRDRMGVTPTVFGRAFLAEGAALLDGEAALGRRIQALAGLEEGTLVVGAGPYVSEISVGNAIARISDAHPRLRLQIVIVSPEEVVRMVKDRHCDVGLANSMGLEHEPDLIVEQLPTHDIHLTCRPGHPLTGKTALELEDVLKFPLVSTQLRGDVAAVVGKSSALGNLDPATGLFTPRILVNSLSLARQIAASSDALFAGTALMLANEFAAGRLVRLNFKIPVMRTSYGIIRRRDRTPSPALELFMKVLRQVEAELAE
jgi:DNA-binding transcriptional LysR family regulator